MYGPLWLRLDSAGWFLESVAKGGYGNIHSRAYCVHVLRFLHVTGMVAMR